ncbi:MAG: hypothetical protein AAF394_06280, partial [Planctomycetota bacterium]
VAGKLAEQRKATLEKISSGKTASIITVQSDAELRSALDLTERHGLKTAVIGASQLDPFFGRIKALNVAVIASPISPSTYNWYLKDIAKADAAGIKVAFAGSTAEQLRLLASQSVASGMNRQNALKALCHGCEGIVSSPGISPGNHADFVVWSGSPLDLAATPLMVVVDGEMAEETQE